MNASYFQECIRILLCMSHADFVSAFGDEVADHLWNKWIVEHSKDAGKFICYLDTNNMRKLSIHFATKDKYEGKKP